MLQRGAGVKTFVGKSGPILIVEVKVRKVRAEYGKSAAPADILSATAEPTAIDARAIPLSCLLFFVIFLLSVHSPQVGLVGDIVHDVFRRRHRRQHGMILIVVLVHSIAAHQK